MKHIHRVAIAAISLFIFALDASAQYAPQTNQPAPDPLRTEFTGKGQRGRDREPPAGGKARRPAGPPGMPGSRRRHPGRGSDADRRPAGLLSAVGGLPILAGGGDPAADRLRAGRQPRGALPRPGGSG